MFSCKLFCLCWKNNEIHDIFINVNSKIQCSNIHCSELKDLSISSPESPLKSSTKKPLRFIRQFHSNVHFLSNYYFQDIFSSIRRSFNATFPLSWFKFAKVMFTQPQFSWYVTRSLFSNFYEFLLLFYVQIFYSILLQF